jgi:hypothetical protein
MIIYTIAVSVFHYNVCFQIALAFILILADWAAQLARVFFSSYFRLCLESGSVVGVIVNICQFYRYPLLHLM